MFSTRNDYTQPVADTTTGLEEEEIARAQEGVPIPYMAGTRKIALRWITPIYNQKAVLAPQTRPSKK